jgi:hypothetical protein
MGVIQFLYELRFVKGVLCMLLKAGILFLLFILLKCIEESTSKQEQFTEQGFQGAQLDVVTEVPTSAELC